MATACPSIVVIPLGNTLGAAFIGNLISAILYGITTVQTYIYFDRNLDGKLLKNLILLLWSLDGLHLALISHTLYFYSVTNFADPVAILNVTWSIMAHVAVTGMSDLITRCIFTYRVWRLSDQKSWLSIGIIIPSLVVFGSSIAFTVRGTQLGAYADLHRISWILYTAFSAGVVADCLIAVALCVLLTQRRTGIRRTDSMVRTLMIYSINTGVLTSLCAIAVLVTYATMPNNFIFIAFYFILPKLFLNSLLATLNAREKLRETSTNTAGIVSIPLTSIRSSRPSTKPGGGRRNEDSLLEIEIQKAADGRTDSLSGVHTAEVREPWK